MLNWMRFFMRWSVEGRAAGALVTSENVSAFLVLPRLVSLDWLPWEVLIADGRGGSL